MRKLDSNTTLSIPEALLIFMIILSTFSVTSLQGQQENAIYLTKNSVIWYYIGATNISHNINELTILMRPMNGEIQYLLNLSLKTPLNISMKLSIDMLGSERIYYQIDSILLLNNYTFGINKINESIEGNINIDLNDIVVQWHKQEIKIPLSLMTNNKTYTVLSLGKELNKMILYMNYTYIKKIDGFYLAEQLRNIYRESFYFYDIYINKIQYLNKLFDTNTSLCKVIDEAPMKTSIDLSINISAEESIVKLNIQGIDISDPIKAYQTYLCILPLLLNIQEISRNINVGSMYLAEFLDLPTSFFTIINQNFIINVLKIYANITNLITKEDANLLNSQIIFNYKNKDQQNLLLSISNIDVYRYNTTQIKTLLKNIVSSIAENIGMDQSMSEIIDKSPIIFQNEYTTFTTHVSNKIDIQGILILIIVAVAIQIGIILYVMIKVVRSRRLK